MTGRPIDLSRLQDLVLAYFRPEHPARRISREQFYTESLRLAGGRDTQSAMAGSINANRLVHFWCRRGDIGHLTELLETEEGSPLCIAARHGHVEAVDLLLKAGVHLPEMPSTQADCRCSPWFECCSAGSAPVFNLLLAARQSCAAPPLSALNLLLEAAVNSAENGSGGSGLAIAKTLLDLGASAETSGPTTAALRAGNGELLATLLAGGAACDPREAAHAESRDRTLRNALARLMQRHTARRETGAGEAALPSDVARLCGVKLAWLSPAHLPNPEAISELTLVDCGLTCLPAALLHGLPRLRALDVSRNRIARLEEATRGASPSKSLYKLDLSHNCLTELPHHVFAIESLRELNVAQNQLGQTAWNAAPWSCRQLEILNLANNGIASLPAQLSHVCGRLVRLFASGNRLTSFPCWACPLEFLDLTDNKISNVPGHLSTLWQNSLRELRLSGNCLASEKSLVMMVTVKTLSRLSLARNQLTTLPPTHLWRCDLLFELDLANNQLEERFHDANGSRFLPLPLFRRNLVYDYELKIPKLTGLHRLILGGNRLHRVPPSVCQLAMLETLDISGNSRIRQIPVELAQCRQLMRLVCDPGQLQEPLRQFVQKSFVSTIPLLNHLRLQLYRTSPYYHLKLVVAGNGPKDREWLMARLGFSHSCADSARSLYLADSAAGDSAGGGERSHWSLDRVVQQNYIRNAEAPLRRNLRDTLLQPPARIFHLQMTRRDLVDAHRRVAPRRGSRDLRAAKLAPARAPKSIVIAIGQNLPPGEEFSVDELVSKWRSELDRTPGYPTVVEFLTLAEKPDDQAIARLRWTVLKWSLELPCPDDVKRGRVIGRQLPMFFTNAMELVVQRFEAIQGCHSAQRYVPLITEDEMLELLKEAAKNCEVPSQAFEKDAEWFLFVLQSVVLFKSTATLSQRGELQISQLKRFLTADLEMPESHTDTFLHLFHDLNICHKLNDKTLLFPNDLAERPTEPLDPEYVPRESLQPCRALLRVYRFPYFPPGLWPRLVARLHSTRGLPAAVLLLHRGGDSVQILSRSSRSLGGWERELLGKRTSICCWRRGFMVKHDDGRFGIQLGDSGVELELCVLSQSRNFAPIGLLVDEVDLLLDTWFPGLASFEEDGYADVAEDDGESNADEGLVGGATSGLMRRLRVPDWRAKVHWFGYRLCAERALTSRPLRCPRCGAAPEPRSLVPELLFADVDRSAIVEAGRLRLRREPDCLLGEGAFGSVYRAWLGDTQVAAKISKFLENFVDQQQQQTDEPVKLRLLSGRRGSSSTRSLESAGATNEAPSAESAADSLVQLERARRLDQAIDGLKRMRHEANVLQALRSPFLVAFRGICLEPLCFLTELAPLGSLAEVREEARKQRPGTALPLGRQLSYKMAY
uniref:ANK_REP_REGION domain-containing protein n=1 Tax=Macrostomum lignano TaxID=282301 RepID=A0A1I8HWN9_9PLAT